MPESSPWTDWESRCGPEATALRDHLLGIPWSRLRVTLENIRNEAAREPPLSVCRAILYHAWKRAGFEPESKCFLFHPRSQALPDRVRKGASYALEVIFPDPGPVTGEAFLAELASHLDGGRRHFRLAPGATIERTDLAALERETLARLDPAAGELCLEFLTPLRWNWRKDPANEAHELNWRLSVPEFLDLIRRRLASLVAPEEWPEVEPLWEAVVSRVEAEGLRLLPYFWEFRRYSHAPKTPGSEGGSRREDWLGMEGPLYLRGGWAPLLPVLLFLGTWHLGQKADQPQGRFLLKTGRTFFDRLLPDPALYRAIDEELREESDGSETLWCGLEERDEAVTLLASGIGGGLYRPVAARRFAIPKSGATVPGKSEERFIVELDPVDRIVQKSVARLLQPRIDRMLEDVSHAWRPGRGIETARRLAASRLREGFPLVLESDIAAFFDEIPWDRLEAVLDAHLPEADRITRQILLAVAKQPVEQAGRPVPREGGLLQGGPLSPLLANLFLDPFDEAMAALGHPLVRYGDDFIVFARDGAHAREALAHCRAILAGLGLSLKEEKTVLTPVEAGFRFLGLDLGRDLGEEFVERSSLRKSLFVDHPGCFLGIDGESLVQRHGGALVGRLPLLRIGEIIVLGPATLSSVLLSACARRGIAVTLAAPSGYGVVAVAPSGPAHPAVAGRHWVRHAALSPDDSTGLAALFVEAKIANHLAWFDDLSLVPGLGPLREALRELAAALPGAADVETVRGIEGRAARLVFAHVHGLVRAEGFATAGRTPREKMDPWNTLLDFASFLLFTRINHLLRARGLNPYLGFLHSPENRYESLVCDLQEPFRPRLERLVLRVVNHRILTANDFEVSGEGRWSLRGAAAARFFEAFEKEMQTRRGRDPGTWRQLLVAQVEAVRDWVEQPGTPLRIYRAGGRRGREGEKNP